MSTCYRVLERRTHGSTSLGGWLCAQGMLELLLHGADEFAESGKHGGGEQTEDDEGPDRQRGDHLWEARCEGPGVSWGGMEGEQRPLSCVSMSYPLRPVSGASFGKGVFTDGIKLRIVLEMSSPWIILDCYDKGPSERKTDEWRQDRGEGHANERPHEAETGVRPPQGP